MWLDDDAWPYPHHPLVMVAGALDPDELVSVQVFQLRPLTVDACRSWCGGETAIVDGGPVVIVPGGAAFARLGDFIVEELGVYRVEPAVGFAQRYIPA